MTKKNKKQIDSTDNKIQLDVVLSNYLDLFLWTERTSRKVAALWNRDSELYTDYTIDDLLTFFGIPEDNTTSFDWSLINSDNIPEGFFCRDFIRDLIADSINSDITGNELLEKIKSISTEVSNV